MFILLYSFFVIIIGILFLNSSRILICLVILEMITFLVLFLTSSLSFISSPVIIISLFCIFVLESVVGLVGFLNLINFSGSDYVSVSSFSL